MASLNPTYSFNNQIHHPIDFNNVKLKKSLSISILLLVSCYVSYFIYNKFQNHTRISQPALTTYHTTFDKPLLPKRVISPLTSPLKKNIRPITLSLKIDRNFTHTLSHQGIDETHIKKLKKAISPIIDTSKIYASTPIYLTLDTNKKAQISNPNTPTHIVRELSFYPEPGVHLTVIGDGINYKTKKVFEKIYETSHLVSGKVTSTLSKDATRAGVPPKMVRQIIKYFSLNIDFRQLQKNDTFEFGYNKFKSKTGSFLGYGKLNYASLTVNGKKHEIFRIKDQNGKGKWFNANGMNSKPLLMKTPIDGARLSSRFGMRRHPVLGYTKQHTGIDFAAQRGTPIYASGDGIIVKKYRSASYGNYIKIRHNKTYDTAYAHMSRFAKFKEGDRVKQGEVIGYVGTTGRSTGPHLHYEVHKNSVPVNPHSNKIPTVSTVTQAMKKNLSEIKQRLVKLRAHQKIEIVHNSILDIKQNTL